MDLPLPEAEQRPQPSEESQALGRFLAAEFDTEFALFDALTGVAVSVDDVSIGWDAAAIRDSAAAGQIDVQVVGRDRFRILLPLTRSGRAAYVAIGELPACGHDVEAVAREQVRLRRWASAVADRIRAADEL